jgi:ligand-binding sensor domain-containing protein/signal transduction histidine kinase/DNA-binding response OmpR family regulator
MKFTPFTVFSILLLQLSSFLLAQEDHYVFSHLDVNDGLSENRIKCIIRDRNGFVWFGSSTGLNRYDGYEFEVFLKDDADTASLFDNDINLISEDFDGNLWIGTKTGINMLDITTYSMKRIVLRSSPALQCADINYCTALTDDSDGNIWIGTHNGLFFYNHNDKSITHILLDNEACYSPFNNITALAHDKEGSVWIGTQNGYIYRYNFRSNSTEKLESMLHKSPEENTISRLFVDNEGLLWVADSYGLSVFNIGSRSWMHDYSKVLTSAFSGLQVSGICQDDRGKIWIPTDGKGLFIITREGLRITNLVNRPYADDGISSDGLISIYIDNTGISWLGTAKKGIDFYKKNVRKFRLIRNYPTESNSLANNDVNCIQEDSRGNLWIGTNGGGLDYLDVKTGNFTNFRHDPSNPNSLSSNLVVSVFEDSRKKIWIGTFLGGLTNYDPVTNKFRIYRSSETDSTTISANSVWSICEDSRENLWVATLNNGLNLYDRQTGKFRRYLSENSSLCFNYLNYITVDRSDNLWICSSNGLIFFNPYQNLSVCYTNIPGNKTSISDNHISSVYEDSRGLFWVCTGNGLNLMDRQKNTFRSFHESDGLPSSWVLRMLEDKNHDLWVSTKNGLSKINVTWLRGGDSLVFSFTNYRISDGLQGKEFNETAAASTSRGELLFGGPDGLNSFYPLEIVEDPTPSNLVFTNLRIFNNIIRPGQKFNNRVLLKKPIFNTGIITLRHRENSITIDFAALNYFFPEKTLYSYQLEGFNSKWIETKGRKNFATYSNLKYGNYTFRLKGTNSDGIWNADDISLKIRILPPIWKTWYAYLIYFIMISGFIIFIRFYTLQKVRLKMKVDQARREAEHIHEIDSLKIKFFTNISHEFRTPLTLILSPTEQMLSKLKGRPEEKHLKLIWQNARRLLLMVNQLLDFRKMEVQGFRYQPSFGDIISFLKAAVASFNDLSEQKHITLDFSSDIEHLDTYFDKDKLEKVIFNLLSNAFKFVHENGKISVYVWLDHGTIRSEFSASERRIRNLVIEVEDNGIGIAANKIDDIFSGFYQDEESGLAEQGNGIGLSLVKEFVRLHDGEVSVKSEPGKGSTFIVTIPLKKPEPDADDPGLSRQNEEYFSDLDGEKRIGKAEGYVNISREVERPGDSIRDRSDTKENSKVSGGSDRKPVIVIAEDNDDLRFYLKENLRTRYHICEASNGESALRKINKIMPDLIISDIMMPGMDGIELCRRLKNESTTWHVPFILLTARYTEEQQIEGIEAGADDYITKPFNFQILESKIENFIRTNRNIQSLYRTRLNIEPNNIQITTLDEQFLQKAVSIVEKNMADAEFTVELLSKEMGMSRTLFYKKVLALTGKPPLEFIRLLRLKRAALLLQKSQLNVSEITFRVGFKDPKYFRKQFLREFGVLPSQYSQNTPEREE